MTAALPGRPALPADGSRWPDELPWPLAFHLAGQCKCGEHIHCWACDTKWKQSRYKRVNARNVRWLLEHVWSHAQLPTMSVADFYDVRPLWERNDQDVLLTPQQAAARWVTKEGRRSRAEPKTRRGK